MTGFAITMTGIAIFGVALVIWSNTKSGEKWLREQKQARENGHLSPLFSCLFQLFFLLFPISLAYPKNKA